MKLIFKIYLLPSLFCLIFFLKSSGQVNKYFNVVQIDNFITINDTSSILAQDSLDWIELPHCTEIDFKDKFKAKTKIGKGIEIIV